MPFKICTFLKTSPAIGDCCPGVSWAPMTYRAAAEPASTILQTVNASKYFRYFIRRLLLLLLTNSRSKCYGSLHRKVGDLLWSRSRGTSTTVGRDRPLGLPSS